MPLVIRPETPDDHQTIHDLTVAAFLKAPHTDHAEQFVVKALRDAGALTLSLVAEESGTLLGHVAVSPVSIADGAKHWFGLGPISVAPAHQGEGIGSQLMEAALNALRYQHANGCVLLGDPAFYRRFGFKPVPGLVLPNVPPEYFQAKLLRGSNPQGEVSYHRAFSANS